MSAVLAAAGPVLIMAGGTGGHVFPALAVAQVLRARGVAVVWLGVPGSMESKLVPAQGIPIEWVRVAGIRGKGLLAWMLAPLRIVNAVAQSMGVLRRVRPRSVLGAGGYVSGPGGIAAWLLRIPLLIHEQNAIAGLTNRTLARLASQVLEAFPGSFGPKVKARAIGNPVREDIAALPPPELRFAQREPRARLLVFGGSQGAQRLNAELPRALARLAPEKRPQIRHQTGERGLESTRALYKDAQIDAEVLPFIDDMAEAYCLGGSRGLPCWRHDRRRTASGGPGGDLRPPASGHRRSSNPERRRHGGLGRGAHHPGARSRSGNAEQPHRRVDGGSRKDCSAWRKPRAAHG